jgi:hypothetical protein
MKWMSYKIHQNPDSLEMQIASLSALVAGGLGVKDASAEDFLIHKPHQNKPMVNDDEELPVMSISEVQSFFGVLAEPME